MAKPVLVTSAAGGNQGKTGRHVAEMLLARGVAVRALVRKIDERSDHLKLLGAEIFVGDFLDVRSMQQAVKNVSSVYFAYPVQDGLADATAATAVAAREEGVSRLVDLVMYQSSTDAATPPMGQRKHHAAACRGRRRVAHRCRPAHQPEADRGNRVSRNRGCAPYQGDRCDVRARSRQ